MLPEPGGVTLDVVQSTAFGGAMNGPKANAVVDGGFAAVGGKLLITEMVTLDLRPVVYDHPAGGVPT
jgi:hypothetical protein